MHINEQSPRSLRRQLRRYFPCVLLWMAGQGLSSPFEHLSRKFTRREMRSASDLFALASHSPLEASAIAAALGMTPLTAEESSQVSLHIRDAPGIVRRRAAFEITVRLRNASPRILKSDAPNPVRLAYHWLRGRDTLVYDGERTRLLPPALPGVEDIRTVRVVAPDLPGVFTLRATLVQEFVRWFDNVAASCYDDAQIQVL
jgi:hypothetical protein